MLPLKQLRLKDCKLLDGPKGLADTLCMLPGLEHLSLSGCVDNRKYHGGIALFSGVLHRLQHLTYLELARMQLRRNGSAAENVL
jgi:hypothetical protein